MTFWWSGWEGNVPAGRRTGIREAQGDELSGCPQPLPWGCPQVPPPMALGGPPGRRLAQWPDWTSPPGSELVLPSLWVGPGGPSGAAGESSRAACRRGWKKVHAALGAGPAAADLCLRRWNPAQLCFSTSEHQTSRQTVTQSFLDRIRRLLG